MSELRFAVILLLLLSFQAHAASAVRIITFEEAIRIALAQNNFLRQAETDEALSEVAVNEARSQFVPDLWFSTAAGQNYGRNFSTTEGRILERSTRTLNSGISSGVTVFNGFSNIANLRGAQFSREASRYTLGRARETVVFNVASNFLALIEQREQLGVLRESLKAEAALEEQIRTFVEAGARTIADLYQQQATVAATRLSLVQQERAAELAKVDLIQTLQLEPRGAYEFEAPTPESISVSGQATTPVEPQEIDLDELLTRALAQRADISAGRARVEAAEQDIRAARGGRWPSLSLTADYNTGYTSASPVTFSDQLDLRRGGSVGLAISVPIFDRQNVRNATRRAELQAVIARGIL